MDFPADSIHGDHPALALLKYGVLDPTTNVSWVVMGAKSRGLDTFASILNAGGDNPFGWSESLGTDTSQTAVTGIPTEKKGRCTFATDQTLVPRLKFISPGNEVSADYEGAYRVFLWCRQDGGNAGDVSVRVDIVSGITVVGEAIPLTRTTNIELLDCGRFEVLAPKLRGSEGNIADLEIWVEAQSDNGTTPNLDVYHLILIPVDEWAMAASWQGLDNQEISFFSSLQVDAGVVRKGATRNYYNQNSNYSTPLVLWASKGRLPELQQGRNTRIFFLTQDWDAANGIEVPSWGAAGLVQLYTQARWKHLRGGN
jgi:hypothetical protein